MSIFKHPVIVLSGGFLLIVLVCGVAAPYIGLRDPSAINPIARLREPSFDYWFGTDMVGRDIYARAMFGAKTSLLIGIAVSFLAVTTGTAIGLVATYIRNLDAITSRVMDGAMAIPAILLAISLVEVVGATILTVIIAISIPEIPRVVRVVRSVILSARDELYVEAANALGTPTGLILLRHVLPNVWAPLIVQATYIAAAAMLLEAILSFLGIGLPPDIPTWGNIMADGRSVFQIAPWIIICPGLLLALVILALNTFGDLLRDATDPLLTRAA
jgi:peptide/nickel transport system permease protein